MGKKDGGASEVAAQDRSDEQQRQATVRQGTARINEIFDGPSASRTPVNAAAPDYGSYVMGNPDILAAYKAGNGHGATIEDFGKWHWDTFGKNEYHADDPNPEARGSPYNPTGGPASSVTPPTPNGPDPYGAFNDDFYKKQRQSYIDYATPQLDSQFADARKQLTFALARGGNLDSSARAQQEGQLKKQYDQTGQHIADQALTYENQTRNSVEDARAQLISMLNSTGDAATASNAATARATALSAPPTYSPLSNLFADFTNTLGTQSALEKANFASGGATGARYNTGLFAPKPASVTVK